MNLRKMLIVIGLAVLVVGLTIRERRDAAERQRHVIYDEASWFVG